MQWSQKWTNHWLNFTTNLEFFITDQISIVSGLGYNYNSANKLIQDSIEIYTGKISYNEYKYLIKNRLK